MSALNLTLSFVFAFVLLLGVLITVHEFGHFIVAKLCGVRVLKFSIGFGSPIGFGRFRLRWERNGTEYVIAWVPLGGFVKMLGEIPGEEESPEALADPSHTLTHKPVWQKLAVVFAGPAMNLLLPLVIFAVTLGFGIDRPAPVVGAVERASPAAEAGILPGDGIVSIGGEPVRWWDEVETRVRENPGERLELIVTRGGEPRALSLPVVDRAGLDVFRQTSRVGWLGVRHRREAATLGIPGADAAAAAAGLRSGDRVVAVGERPVEDWVGFAGAYAEAPAGTPVTLRVERARGEYVPGAEREDETLALPVPALGDVHALGVEPATVLVSFVKPDGAAAAAGLEAGDLILAVDGKPVGSFASFAEGVRASEGRELQVTYARSGRTTTTRVTPELVDDEAAGGRAQAYMVGIHAQDATLVGAVARDQELNPLRSIPRAAAMTWEITALTVQAVKKIVVGEIARNQIGGPIEIARQAHSALEAGWERYLNLLILISVNLAILNLLPIPVLDGGQAVLFAMEGIKRGPLSLRTREIAMQIGVTMVVLLMGFAFWNDLSRYWSSLVDFLRSLLTA